ncbi:MAG: hypothetical protein J6D03_06155 [Clostridia bacterium]|nr:hypothetical protein [Clostridia bacterium]
MEYIMIMENGEYKIELDKNKEIAISDLEQMLDNMINLCKMYNIEDDEILYEIVADTGLEVEKR